MFAVDVFVLTIGCLLSVAVLQFLAIPCWRKPECWKFYTGRVCRERESGRPPKHVRARPSQLGLPWFLSIHPYRPSPLFRNICSAAITARWTLEFQFAEFGEFLSMHDVRVSYLNFTSMYLDLKRLGSRISREMECTLVRYMMVISLWRMEIIIVRNIKEIWKEPFRSIYGR